MRWNEALRVFVGLVLLLTIGSSGTSAARSPQEKGEDLIGHWKLDDEKTSTVAADSSGRGFRGKLVKNPTWTAGKIGGALHFDGKGAHVELPNTPELDKLHEGSYTIMAWFKPDDAPPGKEAENNADYGILIKAGWHEGLYYTNEQKFGMDHWLKGEKEDEPKGVGTESDNSYEPGKFHHVAGVVDRKAGTTKVYVNGELEGTEEWEANKVARDYEGAPWRIGIAEPDSEEWSWPAKGVIDDVRIYSCVLSADEIKAVYEAGAAGKEK